ncbi:alpha/beta hydrolase [Pseudomonas taiwanensis]|uniref:alpha/beta hydrolase n=1 Tax=Pseudomonas taiwanensis TaxID=470150 RepID=UPI0015B9A1E4|nr:alpha/beta hydrolase [Pseudomonas taiwanensis]NWL76673.1 alpha/beta hydrolase [Pseudomonas taiwanensis]
MANLPNILLVHGAWGDASHWRELIPLLLDAGYPVRAVQNPLTSLADDVARTRKLAESLGGPTLLVGHSYGGAVISGAGHAANVVGLVFVAAFAPDEGDSLGGIFARAEPPQGAGGIRPDPEGFLWLAGDSFHANFCADLPERDAQVMAVTQKPIAARCFEDKAGAPAWRDKPSWYQVSSGDHMIPPATQAWMAERIQARKTITLDASHASLASRPREIFALIEEAVKSL